MSQHDYVIDNQSGSLFRSDLNSVLAATVTTNSGAAAPATMYAYMMWADTTSGWLKQRNSANTAWVKLFRLSNASASRRPVLSKGSNYTVVEADFGSFIVATAAITVSLTAVATVEDGFHFTLRNDSASDCTIDPSGAETIDGATTTTVPAGASLDVTCSGSAWYTMRGASISPTGTVADYAGSSVPSGWLECAGTAVSRTTYAALFAAIGTTWGSGDGSTTFNLPDFRGRARIGKGTGSGLTARSLAATGGVETHPLTEAELATHTHVQTSHNHQQQGVRAVALGTAVPLNMFTGASGSGSYNATATANTIGSGVDNGELNTVSTTATNQNTGSGTAHQNMPPFAVTMAIIKT